MDKIIWDVGFLDRTASRLQRAAQEIDESAVEIQSVLLACAEVLGEDTRTARACAERLEQVLRDVRQLTEHTGSLSSAVSKAGGLMLDTEQVLGNSTSGAAQIGRNGSVHTSSITRRSVAAGAARIDSNGKIHTSTGTLRVVYAGTARSVGSIVPGWLDKAARQAFSGREK